MEWTDKDYVTAALRVLNGVPGLASQWNSARWQLGPMIDMGATGWDYGLPPTVIVLVNGSRVRYHADTDRWEDDR